jgi:hypothetical protein
MYHLLLPFFYGVYLLLLLVRGVFFGRAKGGAEWVCAGRV